MTVPSFKNAMGKPVGTPTPQARRTQQLILPAPIGMNAVTPVAAMTPEDCIFTYNLIPNEFGLKTREGYREWTTLLGNPVRTIIPFHGNSSVDDRLFVATEDGIFDATVTGASTGIPIYPWPSTGDASGFGNWTHFTSDDGDHRLILADELNGLTEYDETTGLWTASGALPGPAPAPEDIRFTMAHKNRLWFIEQNSSSAWYLPTGAIIGTATEFNFGSQFREGGELAGLYSWTMDGGDGVDDYMVAVTREGGVAIYRGDDPANASTWALVGVWYIGRVPVGRRIASQYGGQLFILSEHGIVSMRSLIAGAASTEAETTETAKITKFVRDALVETIETRGWEIRIYPRENLFIINSPERPGIPPISYVRNITTDGWGLWRGLPLFTADVFQGRFYFGDNVANTLQLMTDSLDKVDLNNQNGVDVEFSMLTSYQRLGPFKRGQFCRPYFISAGLPSFSVQARYDFDVNENDLNLGFVPGVVSLWDQALWDNATWSGGTASVNQIRGISGIGHAIAIALRGSVRQRATLTAIEVQATPGGLL